MPSRFALSRLRRLSIPLAIAAAIGLAGCGDGHHPPPTIAQTAAASPEFSTLSAVVSFVGGEVSSLLASSGNLTVFAPTNAAFDALARELTGNPAAVASALLTDANRPLLDAVLRYHVLGIRVASSAVPIGQPIDPVLAGTDSFRVDRAGTALVITDGRFRTSRIVQTDLGAANGVIHAIDKVILPPEAVPSRSIAQIAAGNENFTSLVAALGFASVNGDLVSLLSGSGSFTVFAPTNAAFDALARELTGNPQATAGAILVPGNEALVRSVLQYHLLTSQVLRNQVPLGAPITTAQGGSFTVGLSNGALTITDARNRTAGIVATDVRATNGVVHVIDRVILPAP